MKGNPTLPGTSFALSAAIAGTSRVHASDNLDGGEVTSFFTTCAPVCPLPELIQGAHDVHAQLFMHLYAASIGVEGRNDGIWTELSRWNAVYDPLEHPDVVA